MHVKLNLSVRCEQKLCDWREVLKSGVSALLFSLLPQVHLPFALHSAFGDEDRNYLRC